MNRNATIRLLPKGDIEAPIEPEVVLSSPKGECRKAIEEELESIGVLDERLGTAAVVTALCDMDHSGSHAAS